MLAIKRFVYETVVIYDQKLLTNDKTLLKITKVQYVYKQYALLFQF